MKERKKLEPKVGLALSGGGFRATLFHLGSLWRLNELGWLPKLNRITSVSGGSITAGVLGNRNMNKKPITPLGAILLTFKKVKAMKKL